LLSVTLGKAFTECFSGFAECFRHLTKKLFSIVHASILIIYQFFIYGMN
jgi:hypothetical protein